MITNYFVMHFFFNTDIRFVISLILKYFFNTGYHLKFCLQGLCGNVFWNRSRYLVIFLAPIPTTRSALPRVYYFVWNQMHRHRKPSIIETSEKIETRKLSGKTYWLACGILVCASWRRIFVVPCCVSRREKVGWTVRNQLPRLTLTA